MIVKMKKKKWSQDSKYKINIRSENLKFNFQNEGEER